MSLTPEQKQAIREEEFFRAEVRKELQGPDTSPTFFGRVSAFFDTKVGFWLLTTALAGTVATGMTALQRWVERDEIEARERAERSLRDTETLLKLGPMLTSDRRSQVDMAIVLLDGLASDAAVDNRVSTQIKALVQATLAAGLQQDATAEQRAQANAILSYADRSRVGVIQGAPESASIAAPEPPAPSLVVQASLPVRVYIQIGREEDRSLAESVASTLRRERLIVPGIERVTASRVPKKDVVRYCQDKAEPAVLARTKEVFSTIDAVRPEFVALDPNLCTRVRLNHFELWIGASR